MDKNKVRQFIDAGITIEGEYRRKRKEKIAAGIVDVSGKMPESMYKCGVNIKSCARKLRTKKI